MSERRQRNTRPLSRETAYLMLQMKDLLRKHGVHISLAAPNVYDQLLQAAEAIDDEEVGLLYLRLVEDVAPMPPPAANASAFDEDSPFIEDEVGAFTDDPTPTRPSVALNRVKTQAPHRSAAASEPDRDPTQKIDLPKRLARQHAGVARRDKSAPTPITKRVAMHTPRAGLLRCEQCQRTNTVIATASEEEAREIQCACGMVYRVILDARQFDRKYTSLSGTYIGQHDRTKTGSMVIEDLSFGGVKFRVSLPHHLVYNDVLDIQFTLNDVARTSVQERVRVNYVDQDTIRAEFMELNALNKDLAIYLMR